MIDVHAIANSAPSIYRESILRLLDRFIRDDLDEVVVSVLDTSNPDCVPFVSINTHYYKWKNGVKKAVTPPNPRELIGCWIQVKTKHTDYPFVLMEGPTEPGTRKGWIVYDRKTVTSEFSTPDENPAKYELYTGIGSRAITGRETLQMIELSRVLASHGYLPRSGRAMGSDYAIELGARYAWPDDQVGPEIYLPYADFNGANPYRDPWMIDATKLPAYKEAQLKAKQTHPNPDALKGFALAAHTRNVFQVLGSNLASPSSFLLICADPASKKSQMVKGGTATAVRLALDNGIKVFNLRQTPFEQLLDLLSHFKV